MAAAFAITTRLLSGVEVHGGFGGYLWIALVYGVVNTIIGTVLRILTFPLTILTLGLSLIVVNAVLLEITAGITNDLTIDRFWWSAIWAVVILGIASFCLQLTFRPLTESED